MNIRKLDWRDFESTPPCMSSKTAMKNIGSLKLNYKKAPLLRFCRSGAYIYANTILSIPEFDEGEPHA